MVWASLFAVNIAQGLFLLFLLLKKGTKNPLAVRFLVAMVISIIITNIGYFIIRTPLVNYTPQLFGLSFGIYFLLGPLFYLYSKSVIDKSFQWRHIHWLHFLLYTIQFVSLIPFLLADKSIWIEIVNRSLEGNLEMRTIEKVRYILMDISLFVYLVLTIRWILYIKSNKDEKRYLIPFASRIKWLRSLAICFTLFFVGIVATNLFIIFRGEYASITNYFNTIFSSTLIYYMAYSLVFSPDLIAPDFSMKYGTYGQLENSDGVDYFDKLKKIMADKKPFTNPDLKISVLAQEVGIPSHQLSKLINEKCGKNFNDFINEYRVQEFIALMQDPKNKTLSVYGVALDAGFNSKSAFNTTFKKITGKTPSEYKTT